MAGTVGVVNGVAMYTGDGINDGIYYLNLGGIDFSNGRIQMHVAAVEEGTITAGVGIRFRRADEDNWWEFGMSPDSINYVLRKKVAGELFIVSEPGITRAAGDILKVECYEDRINCYLNNTLVISIVDSTLSSNPTVGIRFSALCVDSAVDNFYALLLETDIRTLLTFYPDYEVFVDWDQDDGLTLGDFESEDTTDDWVAYGTAPPNISTSETYVKSGTRSLEIIWNVWNLFQFDTAGHGFDDGGFGGVEYDNPALPFKFNQAGQGFNDGFFAVTKTDAQPTPADPVYVSPGIYKIIENLIPGRVYTTQAWVYVPVSNTPISLGITDISGESTSTLFNTWEKLSITWTATATTHTIAIYSDEVNPTSLDVGYVDEVLNLGAYEDVTDYVLGVRKSLDFRYGRDQARSLASISPGDIEMEFDNQTQIFSPDNPGSVLAGYLSPGKPMLIRATYNQQTVNLFHGFIDNYTLNPSPDRQSVSVSCMDVLQYLSNSAISTDLYPSIQTGAAIHAVLDSVGWPEGKRDIDSGATTIRWWCEEGTNGLQAVQKIVESEGLPANAFVDAFGNFVFRDRHHRFLRNNSLGIQAYIRDDDEYDEPNFSGPITYDIGWKDIINQIKIDVPERLADVVSAVFTTSDLIVIPANQLYELTFKTTNPFYNAILPSVTNGDIVLKTGSGSITSVNMTRTSGQSQTIEIQAGGTAVSIEKLTFRANPVTVDHTRQVLLEDSTSVTTYGPQTESSGFPWTGVNDMDAIAQIILGQRAERLPVVYIKLNNGHPIRISHILNRKLSDRIHIVEMLQTFMNDDYFIEVLEHDIRNAGQHHVLTLGCEKARSQTVTGEGEELPPVFTFDVTGAGFDDGFFNPEGSGFTLSDSLFILDQSNLNEDGLGF